MASSPVTNATKTTPPGTPVPYYSQGLRARFNLDATKVPASPEPQTYANISYNVDEAAYHARSAARLAAGGLETEVPAGWPKSLEGPLCWKGEDFGADEGYILRLSDGEKSEISEALAHFKTLGLETNKVGKVNFPLPNLGKRLEAAAEDLYNGKGFAIIRGLDPDAFSLEDFTVIYLGVSSYIAERRGKQDQRGSMLMHAIEREDSLEPSSNEKPFHTDTVCDCLGLITRHCSATGGRSIIASTWTVYNELAATRPDLIHVLAKDDWPFDTYGREPPFYRTALMYYVDGRIMLNVSRRLLVGAPSNPRSPGIPGLNEAQAEALDALHFTACKYELRPTMEKGDMRFINNLGIMHRRENFENDADNSRHLIRLWLNNETLMWKLPQALRLAWARVFEDDDKTRDEHWDIEPQRKDGKVIRTVVSCD